MARTQDQKRWRDRTHRKSIQVYLNADTVTTLDTLASERGLSRAGVITALLADTPVQAAPEPQARGYRLRKAKGKHGIYRFDWLVIVDGEPIAGLQRYEPINGWRGKYLRSSMTFKWAKGKTRDKVVFDLIDAPYIYR